ncbi:ATP-binding protein [Acetobacterium bakii]|uniref:Histidine kinase n=1 Tax=Acetobacterium bakii TaxID=52689 RepID=A0A0L6TZE8_9FIRM|nr:ATP-binding protein [Acetobacterium bakii]KNZ40930.1 histidine kinase [Acetobacterium bakii]
MKSLTVNASEDKLSEVLEFIGTELEAAGASPKTQFQIDLAVEELYVNIVHYAYAPDTGDVIIKFNIDGEPPLAEILFIDQGKPYNPLENPDPDITLTAEDREIGGLGVLMVKKTMDVAVYRYENQKNIMTIKKSLH